MNFIYFILVGTLLKTGTCVRFWGNVLIALGAILPSIGGVLQDQAK